MRRSLKGMLSTLAAWQVLSVAVGVTVHWTHPDRPLAPLAGEDARTAASLLQPSPDDLRRSLDQVAALPRPVAEEPQPSWERDMSAALLGGDQAGARRLLKDERAYLSREKLTAMEGLLAGPGGDLDEETRLAVELGGVSIRFTGLDAWGWVLWARAATPIQRARLLSVLSGFQGEDEALALTHAALRFAQQDPDSAGDLVPHLLLASAYGLADGQRARVALVLCEEVEHRTKPGADWGPAVYNQGLLRLRLGDRSGARAVMSRLIASSVNDADPGADLMTTNRNYRYWAAGAIADSYVAGGAYVQAWQARRAAEHYPYRSWCGNCQDSANTRLSLLLLRDALLSGPVITAAHLVSAPGRTWAIWALMLPCAGVVRKIHGRRRRRDEPPHVS